MQDIVLVREICRNSHRFSCVDFWDVPVSCRVVYSCAVHVDHLCVMRRRLQESYHPGPLLVHEILQLPYRCRLLSLGSGPFHVINALLDFSS